MPPPIPALEIDLGIGELFAAAERRGARREKRRNDTWGEVKDDIEAIADIVSRSDDLYLGLLERIQHAAVSDQDVPDRAVLIEEVHRFIHDERIPRLLIDLNSRIAVASRHRKLRLKWQKYREISNSLRSLERASDLYVKYLREINKGKVPQDTNKEPLWNLASVLAHLETGESESGLSLYDHCEEAIRNRRSDIIDAVQGMAGRSIGNIRELQL